MVRVFVSYRRDDASPWAGRLHDSLAARLGARNIFQDVVAIVPGQDFTDAIDRALADADAALVVIGPQWLTVTGPDGTRRLAEPFDHVRGEIAAALRRAVRVIPVLVGGATMPTEAELPAGLEPLARRQGVALRDATWQQDVDGLVHALRSEQSTGRRPRRVIAASITIALAVATVAIIAARAFDKTGGSAGGGGVPECPRPTSEWTSLPLNATTPAQVEGNSGKWSIAPTDAHLVAESGRWRVVLTIRASNVGTGSHYQDRGYYLLVVDGVQFRPVCFNVAEGNDPVPPNSTNVLLVGFDLTADPSTGRLALDLDVDGGRARVELR